MYEDEISVFVPIDERAVFCAFVELVSKIVDTVLHLVVSNEDTMFVPEDTDINVVKDLKQ